VATQAAAPFGDTSAVEPPSAGDASAELKQEALSDGAAETY
jgi:hypothetical protein